MGKNRFSGEVEKISRLSHKEDVKVQTLLKRAQFLELKEHGQRVHAATFVVQWMVKPDGGLHIGYTASSKGVGNAVQRNRARRRLRAVVDKLVRLNPSATLMGGRWVNIVAKSTVLTADFVDIEKTMREALTKVGVKV